MTPRQKLAAGATSLFLLAGAALYMGSLTATGDGTGLYGEVTFGVFEPEPTVCVYREGYAESSTLALWVPGYVGGDAYALVRVCVDEAALEDEAEEPLLPPEYAALPSQDTRPPEPYVAGQPDIQVWVQGHPQAPWACACTAEPVCDWNGRLNRYGRTFNPGSWSGAGCHRKPCSEWSGISSWPLACPLVAP